jgi:hypothetical protein
MPQMQGVRGRSKSEPDKAQEEQHFGSVIRIHELIPWKKRRPSPRGLRNYSKSEVSERSGGRTSSSIGSWRKIPQTIRFEGEAQALILCRSRRGDLRDLNGCWRTLEESQEIPPIVGSSGVVKRSATRKISEQ